MLWYGMNIPKSISVKTMFAPRNFHLESTYPFIEPSKEDIIVEGITIKKLFLILGANCSQASTKLCQYQTVGRLQTVSMLIWSGLFKLVTMTIYAGIRNNTETKISEA